MLGGALRRKFVFVLVLLLACAIGLVAASSTSSATSRSVVTEKYVRVLGKRIFGYQHQTWHWQRLMGRPLTETEGRVLPEMNVRDIERAVALWRRRATAARRQAQHPPHLQAWLCIHRYEATWTDSGAPYYGGLQMDLGFQAHYGGQLLRTKGTADRWLPLEQMWVAERAFSSGRGFYPWPNTARYCGLI
jgi:hypothetical protein